MNRKYEHSYHRNKHNFCRKSNSWIRGAAGFQVDDTIYTAITVLEEEKAIEALKFPTEKRTKFDKSSVQCNKQVKMFAAREISRDNELTRIN